MKNTQETLSLPTFDVTLVSHIDGEFEQRQISLPTLLKENQAGMVLYFYPKDNTAGCSVQAEDFTRLSADFANKGYQVIGVSRDGVKSHQNFITKKQLGIALISDGDEALCQHFDVIKEKMMYGKTHLGVVRSTFVFDKTGELIISLRNVKAKEHAQALLEML